MPVLKNARHETVAQALAQGKTAIEAYATAGFRSNRSHASSLVTKGNIRMRVEQIKGRVAEKAEWTAADMLQAVRTFDSHAEKDARCGHPCHCRGQQDAGQLRPTQLRHAGPAGGAIGRLIPTMLI